MNAYDYDQYTAADVKGHWHIHSVHRRISGTSVPGSPSISGGNRTGGTGGDKKAFWEQRLYVHSDLHCELL